MNSTSIAGLIAVVVIVLAGIWYFSRSALPAPTVVGEGTVVNDTSGGAAGTVPEGTQGEWSDTPTSTGGNALDQMTVTYTQTGFSPKDIVIPAGTTVTFVNDGGPNMWVATDPHPAHTGYAGTDRKAHCPDTGMVAFDQCAPGTTYSFTFDKTGSWRYHNHMKAVDTGTITVQ